MWLRPHLNEGCKFVHKFRQYIDKPSSSPWLISLFLTFDDAFMFQSSLQWFTGRINLVYRILCRNAWGKCVFCHVFDNFVPIKIEFQHIGLLSSVILDAFLENIYFWLAELNLNTNQCIIKPCSSSARDKEDGSKKSTVLLHTVFENSGQKV